jgi:hypothetical protein
MGEWYFRYEENSSGLHFEKQKIRDVQKNIPEYIVRRGIFMMVYLHSLQSTVYGTSALQLRIQMIEYCKILYTKYCNIEE